MLLIDKYAYFNRLKHIHPVEKMFLALFLMFFALIVKDTLISLIIFAVMSTITTLAAKIPLLYYVKLLLLPVFFLLSGILPILISFGSIKTIVYDVLWSTDFGNWQVFITAHSIETAIQLISTVLSSMSCLYFLTLTTPVHTILQVLRKLKVPILLIEIAEMTYRFIFVFLETALKIFQAQNSRLGYLTIRQWLHSLSMLISSLLMAVIQRASELTMAMNSRGCKEEILYLDDDNQYSVVSWLIIIGILATIMVVYLLFGGILL